MPLVEIDEEDARRYATLFNTVQSWMKNPKSRRKLLEANKAFDPEAKIPELDQPDPIDERMNPVMAELAALKKDREEEKATRERDKALSSLNTQIEQGFARLRREEGLMQAGEESVRKIMEDKGITDPEVAWAYHQKLHPPQSPVSSAGSWNFLEPPPSEDQTDWKRLLETRGDNNALLDKMSRDALADVRGQTRR